MLCFFKKRTVSFRVWRASTWSFHIPIWQEIIQIFCRANEVNQFQCAFNYKKSKEHFPVKRSHFLILSGSSERRMGLKYFLTILKKEKCFAVLGLSQIKATVESTRESLIEMTTDHFCVWAPTMWIHYLLTLVERMPPWYFLSCISPNHPDPAHK